MKKLVFATMVLGLFSASLFGQTKWNVDAVHSSVKFSVSHLVISDTDGSFKKFSGSIAASKPDFSDATIEFTVDVKSIDTDNENRDNHLKSPDFFDADKYPEMTFKSTSFKKTSGSNYELKGDLTIHGVTKNVKFDVVYGGTVNDGMGNTKAGFKATTVIDRFEYGLKWSKATEAGGLVVGKDVTINLKLEFAKAK